MRTPGAPLSPREQDLCQRALGIYIRRDLAIEGLLDDRDVARRFGRVLVDSRNDDAQRIFAAELSNYAWGKLRHGRKFVRAGRALALARQVAGVRSLLPG